MSYSQHKLSTYLLQTNEIANKIQNKKYFCNVRNHKCLKYLCKIINPNYGIVTFEIFSDIILTRITV